MKKNFTYCLMALLIFISFVTPVNAQVNGTAAKPLVSTVDKPVYYYVESAWNGTPSLNNTSIDARGNLMYAPTGTSGVQLKHNPMATITSSLSADNAIWQVVSENGIVKLKNKGVGLYLNESKFAATTPSLSVTFTPITVDPNQYNIKNNSTSSIVAWTNSNCDRLTSQYWGANGAAAWYFIVVPGSEANYNEALAVQARLNLDAKILDAQNLLALTVEGSGFVYSAESRSALSSAISDAIAVQADNNKTKAEIETAIATLNNAMNTYKTSGSVNPVSLLSASASNYRWYWIKSTSTLAYAQNKVISKGTRVVGDKFTFEAKAAEPADVQLFRFELTDDQTKILNIINKTDVYMASSGAVATASTVDNSFSLISLSDGRSFNIKPTSVAAIHGQENGAAIVNWAGDVGSASAWMFEFAMETAKVTTSLNDANQSDYKVRVFDHMITVDGEYEFEIYSVTGQKQNKYNSLSDGVYFVKLKDATIKVVVR